jgi:hypothetical protein
LGQDFREAVRAELGFDREVSVLEGLPRTYAGEVAVRAPARDEFKGTVANDPTVTQVNAVHLGGMVENTGVR